MKKHWISAVLAVALAAGMVTGCGKQADSAQEPSAEEQTQAVDLSTDNDTFHLNMLSNLIQTSDIGVCELMGDGEHQTYDAQGELATRSYSGILFGQDVTFVISYHLDDVAGVALTFDDTSATLDELADAMTDVLGKKPSGDDGYLWKTDNSRVQLEEQDGVPTITLKPYSDQ